MVRAALYMLIGLHSLRRLSLDNCCYPVLFDKRASKVGPSAPPVADGAGRTRKGTVKVVLALDRGAEGRIKVIEYARVLGLRILLGIVLRLVDLVFFRSTRQKLGLMILYMRTISANGML